VVPGVFVLIEPANADQQGVAMSCCRAAVSLLCVILFAGRCFALCFVAGGNPLTFREEVAVSQLVVFGSLQNAAGTDVEGSEPGTEVVISSIFKNHPLLGSRKVVGLGRYLPIADPRKPDQMLLFADVTRGQLDFYRGVQLATPAVVGYLQGMLALRDKQQTAVLRYCFDYLEHADVIVAEDAYLEFAKASRKTIEKSATKLPATKLRSWLMADNTPPRRQNLYGFLLGHCGNESDACLLRKRVDQLAAGGNLFDEVLVGYVLLRPTEGWSYLRQLIGDPDRDFLIRYRALQAARFFHDERPDVVTKRQVVEGIAPLLEQDDIADIAMHDLRRWQCWDYTNRILAQTGKEGFDKNKHLRRTVLRYALQCPDASAKCYVSELRARDPQYVANQEELLKQEAAP
jgi:hypothetical protein